jgi:hypothetical protein
MRPLGTERRVVAVAWVEPGVVGQPVEDLGGDLLDPLLEGRLVVESVADPAREERVAGQGQLRLSEAVEPAALEVTVHCLLRLHGHALVQSHEPTLLGPTADALL